MITHIHMTISSVLVHHPSLSSSATRKSRLEEDGDKSDQSEAARHQEEAGEGDAGFLKQSQSGGHGGQASSPG